MPAQFVIYLAAKTAVVGISETIRGELAQENIGVTVVCPGPVKTNIHEVAKNRPAQFGGGDAFRQAEDNSQPLQLPGLLEPAQVGAMVLKAVQNDELYVITHGEWRAAADALHAARMAAMPKEVDPALMALLQSRAPAK
jgi:short-subunit dehydrogenase